MDTRAHMQDFNSRQVSLSQRGRTLLGSVWSWPLFTHLPTDKQPALEPFNSLNVCFPRCFQPAGGWNRPGGGHTSTCEGDSGAIRQAQARAQTPLKSHCQTVLWSKSQDEAAKFRRYPTSSLPACRLLSTTVTLSYLLNPKPTRRPTLQRGA